MKKIIYFLLIIILLAGIAGGAYAGYKYFKKDKDTPATETNILTESKELLNNHASITFGEGDSAWTISTADKLEPIYIDDLRAPGKGLKLADGLSSSGGGTGALSNYGISVAGDNLFCAGLSAMQLSNHINFVTELDLANNRYIVPNASSYFYENIFYSFYKRSDESEYSGTTFENEVSKLEEKIAKECVTGDNYYLGCYSVNFVFVDLKKYPDFKQYGDDMGDGIATNTVINIPVYYRVK